MSNKQLVNGFVQIPAEVIQACKVNDKPFSMAEKVMYSYLLAWSNNKEKVFPSAARMCSDLGIGSRTTINKTLTKLEVHGLISIEKLKGKASLYTVLDFNVVIGTRPNMESINAGTNSTRRSAEYYANLGKNKKKAKDYTSAASHKGVSEAHAEELLGYADDCIGAGGERLYKTPVVSGFKILPAEKEADKPEYNPFDYSYELEMQLEEYTDEDFEQGKIPF